MNIGKHRSQSALEYMMTYGWAILIIVIVAVILYSMGIFNPSSSVTTTSSGFSPFAVSSTICTQTGLKIALVAGPIPNNAYYMSVDKIYVKSATGANTTTASYSLTNPVTLTSGRSATILVPNIACKTPGNHYSMSTIIQYSYPISGIGLQKTNTSGTLAGTSVTEISTSGTVSVPSGLTNYENISITNSQSSPSSNPFHQMAFVDE